MSTATSTSRPRRPRRVWPHVVFGCALLALLPTFAACVPVVPPSGPGNASFKNVAVTTTSTAATITFTSPVSGPITVTVGTSLDPTTSKVGQVVLAHQASLKYSATIGGLKPKTGYSFRLAAAGVTPYTDITMLVTKPPVFRNVMTHVHNVDATIDFDYDGVGPVTVTISKTLDFTTHYYMRKVLAAPSSARHWQAYFTDLDAATAYAFQLKADDGPTYADITSIVTKHRDVTIQYKLLRVIDDGDPWPYGCGDFALTHHEQGTFDSDYFMTFATNKCIDSGTSFDLEQFTLARRELKDVKGSMFLTQFYAWDDDRKVLEPECFTDFLSNTCGQLGFGHAYLDTSESGTFPFTVDVEGVGNSIQAFADGELTVTFY